MATPKAVTILSSAELYDPASGTWTATGNLNFARGVHTATLLPNGKVLVAGGAAGPITIHKVLITAELYDPASGTWSVTGGLHGRRYRSHGDIAAQWQSSRCRRIL